MKNSFKTGAVIFGMAVCLAACDPPKKDTNKSVVIDTPKKSIDTVNKVVVDTVKK